MPRSHKPKSKTAKKRTRVAGSAKPAAHPPERAGAESGSALVRGAGAAGVTATPVLDPAAGLAALSSLETLEAGYELWAEQRVRHAAARARHAEERRRIDDEAAFLVGAARAAGGGGTGPGLVPAGGSLEDFVREAEGRISAARAALDGRVAEEEAAFQATFAGIRQTLAERVRRTLARTRPAVRVVVRRVGAERRIVHLERVTPDHSVLLLYLVSGRIPSRYEFLFDDSTEDVLKDPAPLYPDEGVGELRPDAAAFRALLEGAPEVWPVKGLVPLFVPTASGAELYRLLQRGAVMEAELADGGGFRNLLSRDEAERLAGALLRLKLEGKLDLELAAG